jgi:sulfide:quinone oxidoreductase
MAKTILVLGGGVGGLVAATELRERLARQHRVVLIDRERQHLFSPSLLWLLVGDREPEKIARPLERLRKKGVEVIHGEVTRIVAHRREVQVGTETLSAEYIVIALGAELAPDLVPGLAAAGHDFYTLAGAQTLRDALATFTGGRIVIMTAAQGYKCPAAPYEATLLIDAFLRKRGVRERTTIDLIAAEPGPMGVAGPEVSAAVRKMVEERGVTYSPDQHVRDVDAQARVAHFASGLAAPFDLLAYVPPHRPPRVIREAAFGGEPGWIPVDRDTLRTQFEGIYAVGDVTTIGLKNGKLLPRAGVFAHGEAEVVAHNIVREITGKGTPRRFDGHGECFIEVGGGKAGLGRGNFFGEPSPTIVMHAPTRHWHAAKVVFEKHWLHHYF